METKPAPIQPVPYVTPMLTKVFIAMRTDFFGIEDEHVTLQFFGKVSLNELVSRARALRRHVPTQIELNGFANWKGFNNHFYEVGLINAFDTPQLFEHVRTPHVTIRKSNQPLSSATFDPRYYGEKQDVNQLWVGKKSKGKFIWLPIENESFMETAERGWKIFGEL